MQRNIISIQIEGSKLLKRIQFFEDPRFRIDGLKIYPTLVIRGTGLYELWKTGRYKSYPPSVLIDLIAKILALIPPWTRIYRVQRDIPMPLVSSGVEHGNLRELALARMKDFGLKCRDIRTREVGISEIHEKVRPDQVEYVRRDYAANGGNESFLSYEDPEQDILIGLLRLRKCTEKYTFRPELKGGVSIIRELHVYGSVVPVSERNADKFQHQGYGVLLVEHAELIAKYEHGSKKIAIISGVGTRNYYRKLGYELEGPYMVKSLLDGEFLTAYECNEKRYEPNKINVSMQIQAIDIVKDCDEKEIDQKLKKILTDEMFFEQYRKDNIKDLQVKNLIDAEKEQELWDIENEFLGKRKNHEYFPEYVPPWMKTSRSGIELKFSKITA